jgi:hypothetical protein
MWRRAILHAAECAVLLGQTECGGRLLAAETAHDGLLAADQMEDAAGAVGAAARAMLRRGSPSRDVRLLAEAADLVRRAAREARIECLLAAAAGER